MVCGFRFYRHHQLLNSLQILITACCYSVACICFPLLFSSLTNTFLYHFLSVAQFTYCFEAALLYFNTFSLFCLWRLFKRSSFLIQVIVVVRQTKSFSNKPHKKCQLSSFIIFCLNFWLLIRGHYLDRPHLINA